MPVYEYRCLDCASTFEKLVPMSQGSANGAQAPCPRCDGRADKQLSTFASIGTGRQSGSGGGCCGGGGGGGGCACAR